MEGIITLKDVQKQVEDLKTYPAYVEQPEEGENNIYFYHGAQSALDAIANWLAMAIEHNRGRG